MSDVLLAFTAIVLIIIVMIIYKKSCDEKVLQQQNFFLLRQMQPFLETYPNGFATFSFNNKPNYYATPNYPPNFTYCCNDHYVNSNCARNCSGFRGYESNNLRKNNGTCNNLNNTFYQINNKFLSTPLPKKKDNTYNQNNNTNHSTIIINNSIAKKGLGTLNDLDKTKIFNKIDSNKTISPNACKLFNNFIKDDDDEDGKFCNNISPYNSGLNPDKHRNTININKSNIKLDDVINNNSNKSFN